MTKEQISDIIFNEFEELDCQTCRNYNDGFLCGYCDNYKHWGISEEESNRIADEILRLEDKE